LEHDRGEEEEEEEEEEGEEEEGGGGVCLTGLSRYICQEKVERSGSTLRPQHGETD